MEPDIPIRIASIIKSLNDVIAPAVDKHNSAAVEQLALIQLNLTLMGQQYDKVVHKQILEIGESVAMIEELTMLKPATRTPLVDAVLREAAPVIGLDVPPAETLNRISYTLRCQCDEILRQSLDDETTCAKAEATVLRLTEPLIPRERAWWGVSD